MLNPDKHLTLKHNVVWTFPVIEVPLAIYLPLSAPGLGSGFGLSGVSSSIVGVGIRETFGNIDTLNKVPFERTRSRVKKVPNTT